MRVCGFESRHTRICGFSVIQKNLLLANTSRYHFFDSIRYFPIIIQYHAEPDLMALAISSQGSRCIN